MDLVVIMRPVFDVIKDFFAMRMVLGGYTFSVGAFFLWVIVGCVIIALLKGLGR